AKHDKAWADSGRRRKASPRFPAGKLCQSERRTGPFASLRINRSDCATHFTASCEAETLLKAMANKALASLTAIVAENCNPTVRRSSKYRSYEETEQCFLGRKP